MLALFLACQFRKSDTGTVPVPHAPISPVYSPSGNIRSNISLALSLSSYGARALYDANHILERKRQKKKKKKGNPRFSQIKTGPFLHPLLIRTDLNQARKKKEKSPPEYHCRRARQQCPFALTQNNCLAIRHDITTGYHPPQGPLMSIPVNWISQCLLESTVDRKCVQEEKQCLIRVQGDRLGIV